MPHKLVTDEMVEKATDAYWEVTEEHPYAQDIRTALEAVADDIARKAFEQAGFREATPSEIAAFEEFNAKVKDVEPV